jgi:hypothetical protein
MSRTRVPRLRPLLTPLLVATLAASALGQVPISGTIHDGAGGPLLAGTVYHATSELLVPTGTTLTIQAGAIVKFQLTGLHVDGTLLAVGTSASRIRFTSLHDDSAGGDTNGNGPSSGAPDQWRGLVFGADADASVLEYVDVAYSGWGFFAAVRCDAADVTLRNTLLRDGQHGLLALTNDARPIVESCDFQRSGSQPAVFGATFDALPGFAGNTASGPGAGNFIRVDHPTPAGNVSIVRDDCPNGWLVLPHGMSIPTGLTLTLGPGIVVKPGNFTAIHVDGTLITNGTQEEPVVFTSLQDDLYGGDTNNDGPSLGGPDQWQGLRFTATAGGSSLVNTVVRGTGHGFHAAIEVFGSSPSFSDCLLRDGQHSAIDLNGIAATPTFTRCAFQNNFNYAVQIPLSAAAGFVDCVALGSTYGQFLRIVDGTVASPLVLGPENMVNGAFVLANPLVVPQGSSLTLRRGVVFKAENSAVGATIQGAIDVQADGQSPVVFTRIEDDAFGGDTNSNGPSSANPDSWLGVQASATATGILKGVRFRYSGWGFTAGIQVDSPALILRDARTDRCAHDGFRISALAGEARNWVADGCGDRGIALLGGSFALRNATVFGTTGQGIASNGAFTGTIRDSISYGNSGADLVGVDPSKVSYSLVAALAGQNGNFGGDPLFVASAAGDLRLAPGSPCVDGGDPVNGAFGSTGADAGGAPRFTDGNLDGARRIDVGAHEFTNVYLAVSGSATPGGTLTLATSGTAGLPVLLAIGFDGQVELGKHGTLFLNIGLPWLLVPFATIPVTAPLPVPAPLPTPFEIAFQAIAFSGAKANLSNVVHIRFTDQ